MDLSVAGAISGAGQAGTNALNTLQTGYVQNFLQQERDKFELARTQLQEQYANDRLDKQQNFEAGQNQQKFGYDIVKNAQNQQGEAERHKADLDQRAKEHTETTGIQREGLEAQKAHYKSVEAHQGRLESIYKAQHQADQDEVKQFVNDDKGAYYAITKTGVVKPVLDPVTKQPIIGTKGLSESAKAAAEFYRMRIDSLDKQLRDPMTTPEAARQIQSQIQDYSQRALGLLGQSDKQEPVQIVDPFSTSAAEPKAVTTPEPQAAAPQQPKARRDITVPSAPVAQTPPAGPLEAAKAGAGMVAEKAKKGLINALSPSGAEASIPPITKEPPEKARAAVKEAITPAPKKQTTNSLEEAMKGLPPVDLPKTTAEPTLQEVMSYIDAAGTKNEKQIRSNYIRKYGKPPTPELLARLKREARGAQ